jgi:hypothetical protein
MSIQANSQREVSHNSQDPTGLDSNSRTKSKITKDLSPRNPRFIHHGGVKIPTLRRKFKDTKGKSQRLRLGVMKIPWTRD